MPGYLGTLGTYPGDCARQAALAASAKAHSWGVRGKPNELKRLDVPVPVSNFPPAARHQKRKCNSSRHRLLI